MQLASAVPPSRSHRSGFALWSGVIRGNMIESNFKSPQALSLENFLPLTKTEPAFTVALNFFWHSTVDVRTLMSGHGVVLNKVFGGLHVRRVLSWEYSLFLISIHIYVDIWPNMSFLACFWSLWHDLTRSPIVLVSTTRVTTVWAPPQTCHKVKSAKVFSVNSTTI